MPIQNDMHYNAIKMTIPQAESILSELFNIKGKITELPGEIDFNFRVKVEDSEGYILKISRPNENQDYLDFQQKLLLHLEHNTNGFTTPQIIKDIKGNVISETVDPQGNQRKVRLLTWVSGRVWSSVNPHSSDILAFTCCNTKFVGGGLLHS